MERYLLFDSGCAMCTKLADDIERASSGWLKGRSLRDPEIQHLLNRARPNWQWEPTLMEVRGENVRVFTGLNMRSRIVVGLGPRRTWRVLRIVQQAYTSRTSTHESSDLGRRAFLKRAGGFLAGIALLPAANSALAKNESDEVIRNLPSQEEMKYLVAAKKSKQYQDLIAKLQRDYGGAFVLEEAQGRASEVRVKSGERTVMVTYPISGGAGYSGYSLIFHKKSVQVVDDIATFFTLDDKRNIIARTFHGGQEVLDATIAQDGQIISIRRDASSGGITIQARQDCFCCFNGCLANAGVPAWAVTVITLVCGAVCVGTFGTGCLLCAAGAASIASGTLSYCYGQCFFHGAVYNDCWCSAV